jgi:hypothetical protein
MSNAPYQHRSPYPFTKGAPYRPVAYALKNNAFIHKKVLRALMQAMQPVSMEESCRYPERVAIAGLDGEVPDAFAAAWADLQASNYPISTLDAAGRFLDAWGEQASLMGWTAAEIFAPTMLTFFEEQKTITHITAAHIIWIDAAGGMGAVERKGVVLNM